jgi:fructosamine-3-kinase
VHGGDINQCFRVDTKHTRYFLKLNDALQYPRMFEKEAAGLAALSNSYPMKVPSVYEFGIAGSKQFLLLEWIEAGQPGPKTWEIFGQAIAEMHSVTNANAGWKEENYIGSLIQLNQSCEKWPVFFMELRILPLVKKLYEARSFTQKEMMSAERLCQRSATLFPDEPMALLHGDLWSGNKMFTVDESVAIYDPAVYYGNREMDLGMTKLFGGFDQRFFDAYENTYPLEKDWQQRLPLTQLYPLLVHAVLFGGHYIQSAAHIIHRFA